MTSDDEEEDFGVVSDDELFEALKRPADPKKQIHGDGGNLELWDEEFARELAAKNAAKKGS